MKPDVGTVPGEGGREGEAVGPAFFIDVGGHVDIPGLPGPGPGGVGDLGVEDGDEGGGVVAVLPGRGVEVEEAFGGEERDAADEHARWC